MSKSGYIVILWATILASVGFLHAQDNVILQFTGQDQNGGYVKLDRVLVENISKHWQEVLYYPDTNFIMGVTGVEEIHGGGEGIRLAQNVPNPFDGVTEFSLFLPNSSKVLLEIYDLSGRISATYTGSLDPGNHQFRARLDAPQTYLLQAHTADGMVQIKMVNTGHAGRSSIEYLGKVSVPDAGKADKGGTDQPFSFGDVMLYKGFVHLAGTEYESAHVLKEQYNSELIPLIFTLPLPTVTTDAATNITTSEAQLNGSVTGVAGYPVLERGFVFADNAELTGAVTYTDSAGDGSFHVTVSNLQVATRYYYRAYAQTALGVQHGGIQFFDTQAELPEVHTLQVTDVKASRATCEGNVTYNGGAYVSARGVCYSTSPNPTLSDNYTTNGNGDGSFTSLITGLIADTTYYVRAYATNSVGTTYGEQLIFTTQPPFYCGIDSVADYDGNVYHTVEIGQQCWIKENLRTTHYEDGTAIPVGSVLSENVAYRYAPNDNSANVPIYGYLYNWAAVMHGAASSSANPSGVQGICPDGWHVPSEAELMQLINFVSSQSQYGCGGDNSNIVKALSSAMGWQCVSTNNVCYADFDISLNNATGFSAIPIGHAGYGMCQFGFSDFRTSCNIRSSTDHFNYGVYGAATLAIRYDGINIHPYTICYATSVRCLLDDSGVDSSIAVTPLVTTVKIEDITSMSARTGGFVSGSGGTPVTSRGVCWSTTPNPTVNNGHTFDGDGTGGYTSGIAGLAPGTTYYIRAYATNSAGTAYGEQRVFTTTHPINDNILIDAQTCPGADTVTDYDGNLYHTLQLGQQCWLKENLRTTHYADGTAIAPGSSSSLTVPYRYAPRGQDSNVPLYGYLYNWAAVMRGDSSSNANPSGVQGVCPTGWHVPSLSEWEQLVSYVGGQPQYVCGSDSSYIAKALASEIGWYESTNACAPGNERYTNNATGFSALPAGYYLAPSESYSSLTGSSVFWSSYSDTFQLQYYKSGATVSNFGNSGYAFSVRCLRD
ncbi:MAG: hypothetical protein IK013_07850 [Bacteroidales bacterium]|nr:hypothetical protein [Bacteroidales bacterium]